MEIKDEMLKHFFSEHKKEIDNFGFSARVQRQLPDIADRSWIVWLFAAFGFVISVLLCYFSGILNSVFIFFNHISPYLLPGIVFWIMLLMGISMIINQSQNRTYLS